MNLNTRTGLDDKINGLLLYAMVVVALLVGVAAVRDELTAVDPASVQATLSPLQVATAPLPEVE